MASGEFEIACGCCICYSVFVICLQTDGVDAPFFIQFSESFALWLFIDELDSTEYVADDESYI